MLGILLHLVVSEAGNAALVLTLCNRTRTYDLTTYFARSISVCTRTSRKCSSSDVAGSALSKVSMLPWTVSFIARLHSCYRRRGWDHLRALGAPLSTHLLLHFVQHAVDELALPLQHIGHAALLDPSALEETQVVLNLGLCELLLREHCGRERMNVRDLCLPSSPL